MRRAVLFLTAVLIFLATIGGTDVEHRPADPATPATCAAPATPLVPDRWIELRRLALDESCDIEARMAAVQAMARAGPYANLVLPALKQLATEGPESLRTEAQAIRRKLIGLRTGAHHDFE